jgi:DNA-binding GntR family transcriptional regulator
VTGIERITLNERVYQRLRGSLAGGEIMPNSRLDEEALGRELGVSRTPIREAIGKLTKEGFVEYRPYQGNFVRSFSAAQVDGLYTVRQALESLAVRLAVPRLGDADLQRLIDILGEAEAALERGDLRTYGAADRQFHRAIAEYSGNETLIESLDRLSVQVRIISTVANHDPGVVARTAGERPRIVAALAARDAERAAALMEEHINGVRQAVVSELAQAAGADRQRPPESVTAAVPVP